MTFMEKELLKAVFTKSISQSCTSSYLTLPTTQCSVSFERIGIQWKGL